MLALSEKSHVRIDVILSRFPIAVQGYLNVMALLFLNAFMGLATWRAWEMVLFSFDKAITTLTPQRFPLAYPQAIWAFGLTTFEILALLMLVEATLELLRGRTAEVAVRFGPSSVEKEVEAVLQETIARLRAAGELEGEELEQAVQRLRSRSGLETDKAEESH